MNEYKNGEATPENSSMYSKDEESSHIPQKDSFYKKREIFLVDTNLLVYAHEAEESAKKKIAQKVIERGFKGNGFLAFSSQNLSEFFFIATRKIKLDAEKAREVIEDIIDFEGFKKISYSERTVLAAIDIVKAEGIPFWDALIAAAMLENNVYHIYTENTRDFSIAGITAINPFTQKKAKKKK